MTDELITRLSQDLRPVRRSAMQRLLFGGLLVGAVIAAIAMLAVLGLRADIAVATATMMFWTKSGYTLALGLMGAGATLALARPGGQANWPWIAVPALFVAVLVGAFWQLSQAQPDEMMTLVIGGTSLVCPWRIVGLSLPILAGVLLVMRRFAPTNPTQAGLAAGLLSGGFGAWVYSFACGENGMMFLAVWYTLGIAITVALGAVLGRYLLRW
jgi:hypothetical protein